MNSVPKKILLDTDPGIDDSCAILLALASPELSLEGLSIVHGNCSLEQATKNALSVLEGERSLLVADLETRQAAVLRSLLRDEASAAAGCAGEAVYCTPHIFLYWS